MNILCTNELKDFCLVVIWSTYKLSRVGSFIKEIEGDNDEFRNVPLLG